MSSILKALKRIEESTLPAENGAPAAALGPRAFGRSGRPRGAPWVIACLLAVAAASGFFLFGRDGGEQPPAGIGSPQGAPGAVRAKITDTAGPAPPPPFASAAPTAPPAAGGSAAVAPPPLPRRPTPQALPPRPAPRASREAPRPPAADPAPSGPRTAAAPRSAEDGLSRLEGSKLKLMAIAWYADPARRIAVINGSIVKEGESVEGFRINQIRKDDVIVSDGSRSWRVEFGLKTQP